MTYTPKRTETMPIPVEPGVMCAYVKNHATATDTPVYVPWKNCQLSYAYSLCVEACTATSAGTTIVMELNAASGTAMQTITIAAGATAVGVLDEAAVTSQDACENLSSDNTSRDVVNLTIDGPTDADGAFMVYMYFETWNGE
jgi:hypothetical protein